MIFNLYITLKLPEVGMPPLGFILYLNRNKALGPNNMKIGILKEGKIPIDRRVPLTPAQARELLEKHESVEVLCKPSDIRCFNDEEYKKQGIPLGEDLSGCDVLLGVKEVPIEELIPEKTYFFFSHTVKEQPYNAPLLKAVLDKNIRLVDYELLTDNKGARMVAFGRYAGIVGAYNGLWTYGKKYNLYDLRRAYECFDLEDLKSEYKKIKLPPIKIAITGGGRVAKGAMEVFDEVGIKHTSTESYLKGNFDVPVYTQLNAEDYNKRKDGQPFDLNQFYRDPSGYEGDFFKYATETDLLIAGAYWDPSAPVLFTKEDMGHPSFKIKVIADITCDIEGSIPSTKQPSTIDDPVYDYNHTQDRMEEAFKSEANVTVMAVDNLPCELPRNASNDFGQELLYAVLPELISGDKNNLIKRATIADNGKLRPAYTYLKDYVYGLK